MAVIPCIRSVIEHGGKEFVLYSGFMSSEEIFRLSTIPKFQRTKPHLKIAEDLRDGKMNEWQRPLLQNKVEAIIKLYSDLSEVKVMPNGVLLGVDASSLLATPNSNPAVFDPENVIPEENPSTDERKNMKKKGFYNITIEAKDGRKPLIVLDGQHRITGMAQSKQKNQPVPFVICHKGFSDNDLAEIFTHVTTEATPMNDLHKAWMQYSFQLGKFKSWQQQKSGKTVVLMCTENNHFQGKIKFNDTVPVIQDENRGGFNQGKFNLIGWSSIIYENFYKSFTTVTGASEPIHLANTISNFVIALNAVDSNPKKSKFFTTSNTNKYHATLCKSLIQEFLKFLRSNTGLLANTIEQWKDFLQVPHRQWNNVQTDLPYVLPIGQNAVDLKSSAKIADKCFELFFNNPANLSSLRVHQWLKGDSGHFYVYAYEKKANGKIDSSSEKKWKITATNQTVDITDDGKKRTVIRFGGPSDNWVIGRVYDADFVDETPIAGINVKKAKFDIAQQFSTKTEKKMYLTRQSYHSSSKKRIDITINW
jgi:hypothetical protein